MLPGYLLYALKSRVRQVVPRVSHALRILMDTTVLQCIEIASNFNVSTTRSIYVVMMYQNVKMPQVSDYGWI